MLLVGSGLLIIVDNTGQSSDEETQIPEQIVEEPVVTNQQPVAFVPDVIRTWDGQNSIISGYVFDESPTTTSVIVKLINPVTNGEFLIIQDVEVDTDGEWNAELPTNEVGSWMVMVTVTDDAGLQSENVFSELTVSEPDEADVRVTFLWEIPLSTEAPEGTLLGVAIHEYPETCTVVYKPLYQSPLLDIYAEVDIETGEFMMQFNTCLLYTSPSPRDNR